MKDFFKKRISVIVIVILLFVSGNLFFKNLDLKNQILIQKTIPDVELINSLDISSSNIVSGTMRGYVVFDDKEKQPRDFRQYVELTASEYKDKEGKQIFTLRDIIKMNVLSPRYLDPVFLAAKDLSGSVITLSDIDGNLYFIDKYTKKVKMLDNTGDATKLITRDSEFEDFIRESFD